MIDLYELYLSFQSFCNTYIGGWYRPDTDFTKACNDISKILWVKWTRLAEKSQEARDNLFPFLVSKNMIVSNSGVYGTFLPPVDPKKPYGRFASARIIVVGNTCVPSKEVNNGKCSNGNFKTPNELTEDYYDSVKQIDVEMIDDQRWGACNKHKTKGPKLDSPKMRQIDGKFEVAPRLVSVVVLDYYRPPCEATFKYTISPGNVQTGSGDMIIYDKKNSTPLEWPFNLRDEFLIELGIRYSMFTKEQFLAQMSIQKKQTA
jgi:hypothetical protein